MAYSKLFSILFIVLVVLQFTDSAAIAQTESSLNDAENDVMAPKKNVNDGNGNSRHFMYNRKANVKSQSNVDDVNDFDYPMPGKAKVIENIFRVLTPYQEAVLEQPRFRDQLKIGYDRLAKNYAARINARPIVDQVTREDKSTFKNNGDPFLSISRSIIEAAQNASNFFNSIIDIPYNVVKKIIDSLSQNANDLSVNFGL